MRIILCSILIISLSNSFAFGQSITSFSELDRQVKRQQGGWSGSKQPLARLFNLERNRLGNRFESELLKYLGDNLEKHYWISLFLEDDGYLQGNKPLPYLSLLIKQQALSLLEGKKDEESLSSVVMLSVMATVLSERLGFHLLAISYKSRAEQLMSENSDLKGSFPAMSEDERKSYDSVRVYKNKSF